MSNRVILTFIIMFTLFLPGSSTPARGEQAQFSLDWQFRVDLPGAGMSGVLRGKIAHLGNTRFGFSGEYKNIKAPINSGPVSLSSVFSLEDGKLDIISFRALIHRPDITFPELGLDKPEIELAGTGSILPAQGRADFDRLTIKIDDLPTIDSSLSYSPAQHGALQLQLNNPAELLLKLAEILPYGLNEWDKSGIFSVDLNIKNIEKNPQAVLKLGFREISAVSPDGAILLDGISGNLNASVPSDFHNITTGIEIKTGESLYDTLYVNFTRNPLVINLQGSTPDASKALTGSVNLDWKGIGKLKASGNLEGYEPHPEYSIQGEIVVPDLTTPFTNFVVEPLSLGNISAAGRLLADFNISTKKNGTMGSGIIGLSGGIFNSESMAISGINARLPFALNLDRNFTPIFNELLPEPPAGTVKIRKIKSGPLDINELNLPVTVSSNEIKFGEISPIKLEGGQINLSNLYMKNPFNEDFVLHGEFASRGIELLPLSPKSLPVEGRMGGDLEFWLLKNSLSTNGNLEGRVYGGEMTVSEIFAENIFESSRQYGADFKINDLNLEPLSKALDIGRITGRMDFELTDLVIAYDQPAAFRLHAITTPGSDTRRDISLKAVNTLSVIGTGSGLTGAGVGVFSQFFKEFGYSKLGLACTLDADLFRIRGLIREDGIEYIIKRPPLFGINVINSNPENLISFSDMLKRIKRVIGN